MLYPCLSHGPCFTVIIILQLPQSKAMMNAFYDIPPALAFICRDHDFASFSKSLPRAIHNIVPTPAGHLGVRWSWFWNVFISSASKNNTILVIAIGCFLFISTLASPGELQISHVRPRRHDITPNYPGEDKDSDNDASQTMSLPAPLLT